MKTRKTVRTSRGIRKYTYLGCPMTRNRSAWCYRLCPPDSEGKGRCGRVAPHSLLSRTQLAILKYKRKQLLQHFEKLENMYLAESCSKWYAPGIRVASGEAEILVPYHKKFRAVDKTVHGSVVAKALSDAALFAVNSFFDKVLIRTVSFTISFITFVRDEDLIAKGLFIGVSGKQYLAEAVVTDRQGVEVARGNGVFEETEIALSAKLGYSPTR
jgi:acyl-coenzyme A thioesterase PaaI-like protein